jgi:hypothetical protein
MASASLDFDSLDYYTEPRLINDPNPYFEHLRARGPVTAVAAPRLSLRSPATRRQWQVYTDLDTFSSVNAVTGPFPPVPFPLDGGDITDQDRGLAARIADEGPDRQLRPAAPWPGTLLNDAAVHPDAPPAQREFLWKLSEPN